jgi:RND superfamily putative drug exporter
MGTTIGVLQHMYSLLQQLVDTTHRMVASTHELQDITNELRDHLADFQDFFRPLFNYLYWEPHCFDIPVCWSIRSVADAVDGIDQITTTMEELVKNLDQLDVLLPQILLSFPQMIATLESTRTMMLTMHSTMSGTISAMEQSSDNATAMGKAFDAANNDDSFYLAPEVFKNEDFKRVLNIFLSPDGKATRMLISQRGDPATPEGVSRVDPIKDAAEEALKGTPLEDSYDLLIAGVSALCLIFIIMLLMTRAFVAALVIVGTVALSLGASFGLSILVWQNLLGLQIHWMVLAMAVMVLLAVGSDYNLLLVSRMKEEVAAGINTGIIRAMGGTGRVVTAAGLVFAATMASMLVSDLLSLGQLGSTIALGLLFDTLVVRAFMTPSIAALLGRWFWWPQRVRPRPASALLRSVGPRPLVRSLLLRD